ncbi:MAG TPA: hypothetical protein VJX70_08415 [Candidatus Acidoferrum sp.]|nr:hypothetical protein [Candidatus Acidoferrum sp.]
MDRRTFISLVAGAAVTTALPSVAPDSYWCDCGLVQYFRQPEGHFLGSYIFIDGERKRFTYELFLRHNHIHRRMVEERKDRD